MRVFVPVLAVFATGLFSLMHREMLAHHLSLMCEKEGGLHTPNIHAHQLTTAQDPL